MMKLIKCIGSGSYGKVYLYEKSGKYYAVKQYSANIDKHGISDDALKDYVIYNATNDISVSEIFIENNLFNMVMSYYGKNLYDVKPITNDTTLKTIFYSVITQLKYLHRNGIVHRDIKPQNILYNDGVYGILIDYGISSFSKKNHSRNVYTPWYRPPEVANYTGYNYLSDIWALGLVILECVTGKQACELYGVIELIHGNTNTATSTISNTTLYNQLIVQHPTLINLVSMMTQRSLNRRFNAVSCLQHEWFKSLDIENVKDEDPEDSPDFKIEVTQQEHEQTVLNIMSRLKVNYHYMISTGELVYIDVVCNTLYIYYNYMHVMSESPDLDECLHLSMKLLCDKYQSKLDTVQCNASIEMQIIKSLDGDLRFYSSYAKKLTFIMNSQCWSDASINTICEDNITTDKLKLLYRQHAHLLAS